MQSLRQSALSKALQFARGMICAITLGLLSGNRQYASGQIADAPTLSLDPRKTIPQYNLDLWHYDQGLPQSAVQAIVQTPDGYLWLGLEEGLVRFDGVQFTHFHKGNTEAFTYNDVTVLLVDRAGNLWIGTDGGGLLCCQEGNFVAYTTKQGLAGDVIESIYEDRQGVLWIGTNRGLSQRRNGKFTTVAGLPQNAVLAFCEDRAGNLWIGTDGGGLHCYTEGKLKIPTTKEGLANDVVWAIHEDKTGRLWMGTNGGLHYLYEGKFTRYTTKDGLASDFVRAIVEDRTGSLWIGTRGGGVNRWRDGRFTAFSTKQGLSSDFVDALFEDREGSLWIGTYGGGLNRLRDGKFTNYSIGEGLSNNMVWTIYEDKAENLWFGTDRGLNRFKDGKFAVFTTPQNDGPTVVTALCEDRAGNFWIGTGREGLYCLRQNNWTHFTTQNGLSSNAVRSVLEDRQGHLWIGTDRGLNRFHDGRFQIYRTKDGLSSDQIRYLCEDKAGALWIGTRTGGLNRLKDGKFTIYTTKDGLSSDLIRPIYEDTSEGGTLWIGTNGGGLNRYKDGKFVHYTAKEGLFDDSIFQILEDARGNFWMSCNKGIFRVSKQELNDFAEDKIKSIHCVAFEKADGMKTNECNGASQPAGWKTRDGKMWFPTIAGVAMIDPENIRINPLPPPVVIEQVLVDRQPIALVQKLQLAPGSKNLEFHYAGLSFLAPQKVKFKYQLEGYDDDWIDAGTRRAAFYTNIAPGNYKFRVKACNNDGVWNETGAGLGFSLQPYFYQTTWFYFLGFLALVLSGAGAYRHHVRQIRQREEDAALRRTKEELETRVQERTAELTQANEKLQAEIIERRRLGAIVQENEVRFRQLTENIREVFWLTDVETGQVLYVSPAYEKIWGHSRQTLYDDPLNWMALIHLEDRPGVEEAFHKLRHNESPSFEVKYRVVRPDDSISWIHDRGFPVYDEKNRLYRIAGIAEDITEKKQAEAELKQRTAELEESKNFLNSLIDNLPAMFFMKDAEELRFVRLNRAGEEIIGLPQQEMLGKNDYDFFPKEQADFFTNKDREVLRGNQVIDIPEEPIQTKWGTRLLHTRKTPIVGPDGQAKYLIGVSYDITVRKQAVQALRESEERFRQLTENVREVFWMTDIAKNEMIYVSPIYEEIWGRSRASLYESPRHWLAAIHPDDLQRVYEAMLTRQTTGKYDEIYRIQRPDGELRWIRDRAFPIRDQQGRVYRIAGIAEDITTLKQAEHEIRRLKEGLEKRVLERTAELRGANAALQREVAERQRAQEQLQESEDRFRQLAANINEVLWMESLDRQQLLYVSPVYEKIWGRSTQTLYEQPGSFVDTVHEEDNARFREHLNKQRRGEFSEIEYRIQKPDGSLRWIRDRSFPIRDAAGNAYRSAGISEDITERRQMEEQIRRHSEELEKLVEARAAKIKELERQRTASEKLTAAGRMAARIAHEINNPLAGIQSSFHLIKDAIPVTHRYYHYAEIIDREIERIAGIIRQMYDLYRPETETVRPFRIVQTINDIVTLLKASSHECGVTITCDTGQADGVVTLSEGLLRQVLYNLLQNAIEASPAGKTVQIAAVVTAKHFRITVADQGHGIPEELRSKIFEPFFTTKNSGRQIGGLGLGLSVTKSIVEAMGGAITFTSQINQGTVFTVELPL